MRAVARATAALCALIGRVLVTRWGTPDSFRPGEVTVDRQEPFFDDAARASPLQRPQAAPAGGPSAGGAAGLNAGGHAGGHAGPNAAAASAAAARAAGAHAPGAATAAAPPDEGEDVLLHALSWLSHHHDRGRSPASLRN